MDGLRAVPSLGGPTSGRLRRLWESVYPKPRLAPLGGSPAEVIALAVEVFPSGKPLFQNQLLSVLCRKAFILFDPAAGCRCRSAFAPVIVLPLPRTDIA